MVERIFIVAGEASGDQLGAGLISALKKLRPGIQFEGIGGSAMQERGMKSLFPMSDLALMGFVEVLPHLPRLISRINQTVRAIEQAQPSAVITIDSPGFVFRVIRKLRARGKVTCPLIHYVAPTVWAYKPERAATTAALFDHLMVLLPFEPPYFRKERLQTTFVGHPVLDDLDICFRQRMQSGSRTGGRLKLCLMPGSREGEIARLLPIYEKTVRLLANTFKDISLVLPATEHTAPILERATAGWPWHTRVVTGLMARYEAFYDSDFAICKSGTVTLEASKTGLPMVVVYKVNGLSARLLKPMLKIKYFNLVNIIQEKEVIPELIQQNCKPSRIAACVSELVESKHQLEKQKSLSYEALRKMQPPSGGSASELAARTVLLAIERGGRA